MSAFQTFLRYSRFENIFFLDFSIYPGCGNRFFNCMLNTRFIFLTKQDICFLVCFIKFLFDENLTSLYSDWITLISKGFSLKSSSSIIEKVQLKLR